MIIRTRLASDSPLYRLTEVQGDTPFPLILKEIINQWSLSSEPEDYNLVWQKELLVGSDKEWQLFQRLHLADKDDIVELQVVPFSTLVKKLPSNVFANKGETSLVPLLQEKKEQKRQSSVTPAPPFAFHSVDPQPLKAQKTYAQKIGEEAQERKMRVLEKTSIPRSDPVEAQESQVDQAQEEDQLSAFDQVMARSRMQGEGLNQFFGTIMANRAGHSPSGREEEQPTPDATGSAANPPAAEAAVETEEMKASSSSSRPRRSKEEIESTNSFMENAWMERLKQMGHRSGGTSLYPKGKERQIGENAPEPSRSPIERRTSNGVDSSEEALEDLGPLQEKYPMPGSPTLTDTIPASRPASSFNMSTSGSSAKMGLSRFLRKGQYNKKNTFFSSQPASLHGSGTATPCDSESGGTKLYQRRRSISFRSLTDALLRDHRVDKSRWTPLREGKRFQFEVSANGGTEETCVVQDASLNGHSQSVGPAPALDTIPPLLSPSKLCDYEIKRPTLLRASHSTPLSSTTVNLPATGGISLHISSVGQSAFQLSGKEEEKEEKKVNLFDLMLPREIRLRCFEMLIRLHEEETETAAASNKIQEQQYVGKDAAICELMKLTRVSRTWQSLLLDGQLCTSLDSAILGNMSNASLLRLTQSAGPFIKHLNLEHAPDISPSLIVAIACSKLSSEESIQQKSMMKIPTTLVNNRTIRLLSLTTLNLKGCRNITTRALHTILVRLPSLKHLNISNLDSVTNDTCLLLGSCCANLQTLDISRCFNMSSKGLVGFIQAAQGALYDKAFFSPTMQPYDRQESIVLPLEELRAAGCADVNGLLMALIGETLRWLKVLDLSYCSDLNDDGISALVAHPGPKDNIFQTTKTTFQMVASYDGSSSTSGPFITLTPRQAGGDIQSDETHYRRLLGSLRHISLSSCQKLTDRSCIYLAHAVPNLEYLELANIGAGLRDEGLIALFKTLPQIRKLDLEGASELTEKVLETLTPDSSYIQSLGLEDKNKGTGRRRLSRKVRIHDEQREDVRGISNGRRRRRPPSQRPSPPGAHLSHLILSGVLKPDSDCLINLIRRCPRLTNLHLDDTAANDAILKEFVNLSHQREARGAYLNLVDCRFLSRSANSDILAQAGIRLREGKRGRLFMPLEYCDGGKVHKGAANGSAAGGGGSTNQGTMIDECDDGLIVVKTFYNWELRSQQRRTQQRRNQRAMSTGVRNRYMNRTRQDSLGAALFFIGGNHTNEDGESIGRWGRITGGLLGQGDDGEDARGCSIM